MHTLAQQLCRLSLVPFAAVAAATASAQSWSGAHPAMPGWRTSYASAVAEQAGDNQIFVFGGIDGLSASADVFRFHRTYGWSSVAPLPSARVRWCAATTDATGTDVVHVFGGGVTTATTTHWSYDPNLDTWDSTTLAPLPAARFSAQAVAAQNDRIYVLGGRNTSGSTVYSTMFVYDPVLDSWSTGPAMPTPRTRFAAVADCDGYIWVYGGETGSGIAAQVDCFDTASNLWISTNPHVGGALPPMPTPRSGLAGALGRDGAHYLMGGYSFGPVPAYDVEAYDPYSNTWSFESPMLQSRGHFGAHGVGSRIWVLAGQRKINPDTNKVESYGPLFVKAGCVGQIPALPPVSGGVGIHTTLQLEEAHQLVDLAIRPFETQWFTLPAANGSPQVLDLAVQGPNQALAVEFLDAATLQVLPPSPGGSPYLFSGQRDVICGVSHTGAASGDVEFSMLATSGATPLPMGEVYCTAAVPNSTGFASEIAAAGSDVAAARDLTLSVDGLPASSYGYFLCSTTQHQIAQPGGSIGVLCLYGDIGRFAGNVLQAGAGGDVSLTVDSSSLPGNPPTAALAGDTWNFTYWHRDAGAAPGSTTSNFSTAISVTFR